MLLLETNAVLYSGDAYNYWEAGVWYHGAATFGPRGLELWVNGKLVASDPSITDGLDDVGGTGSFVMGCSRYNDGGGAAYADFFDGKVEEFRVSDVQRDTFYSGGIVRELSFDSFGRKTEDVWDQGGFPYLVNTYGPGTILLADAQDHVLLADGSLYRTDLGMVFDSKTALSKLPTAIPGLAIGVPRNSIPIPAVLPPAGAGPAFAPLLAPWPRPLAGALVGLLPFGAAGPLLFGLGSEDVYIPNLDTDPCQALIDTVIAAIEQLSPEATMQEPWLTDHIRLARAWSRIIELLRNKLDGWPCESLRCNCTKLAESIHALIRLRNRLGEIEGDEINGSALISARQTVHRLLHLIVRIEVQCCAIPPSQLREVKPCPDGSCRDWDVRLVAGRGLSYPLSGLAKLRDLLKLGVGIGADYVSIEFRNTCTGKVRSAYYLGVNINVGVLGNLSRTSPWKSLAFRYCTDFCGIDGPAQLLSLTYGASLRVGDQEVVFDGVNYGTVVSLGYGEVVVTGCR